MVLPGHPGHKFIPRYISNMNWYKDLHGLTNIRMALSTKMVIAFLMISDACNFDCSYCINKTGQRLPVFPTELNPDVLRFLNEVSQSAPKMPHKPYLYFGSGEPTLFVDKIQEICQQLSIKYWNPKIVTNGYLLDSRKINKLLGVGASISVSYDGKSQLGTRHKILSHHLLKRFGTATVVAPGHIDALEILQSLRELKPQGGGLSLARHCDWSDEDVEFMRKYKYRIEKELDDSAIYCIYEQYLSSADGYNTQPEYFRTPSLSHYHPNVDLAGNLYYKEFDMIPVGSIYDSPDMIHKNLIAVDKTKDMCDDRSCFVHPICHSRFRTAQPRKYKNACAFMREYFAPVYQNGRFIKSPVTWEDVW